MQIGIIGDIHGAWDDHDTAYFNTAGYDALLFTGDLPRFTGSLPVARALSALTTPAWMVPGNHDATGMVQFIAEKTGHPRLTALTALGMPARVAALAAAMAPITLGGYSRHVLGDDLALIIARPHSMGGDRLYFADYLRRVHGVTDFDSSRAKLCALIDAAPRDLIVLAHNGPAGLGATPDAPFGCDFAPELGDFGDPDLRDAIAHAHRTGHRVRAVVAGHMHHWSGHTSTWRRSATRRDGTLYLNAARVPRIEAEGQRRHHIRLRLDTDSCRADTVWVDGCGHIVEQAEIEPFD